MGTDHLQYAAHEAMDHPAPLDEVLHSGLSCRVPAPVHTPYDGSARPFQIGLKPLALADWIDVDRHLPAYLDEKDRLVALDLDRVFAAERGTDAAQREVMMLLVEHLPQRFPQIYRRNGDSIEIGDPSRRVSLSGPAPPLLTAARLIQDDLVLMRQSASGWRLAAASLSFPSAWSLREKFGLPMHEVHGPVPGFGAGTRPAELIDRMFSSMRPETPMLRWNWSLFGDDRLYHPESSHPGKPRFGDGPRADSVFFRIERQTIRKLPLSGDILFAIRIYIDPLAALEAHPDAAAIATALIGQLEALSDAERDYKGLTLEQTRVVARLREIAGPAA